MRITIKVESYGEIYQTSTTNPEIAEMQLHKFTRIAQSEATGKQKECDKGAECKECNKWENIDPPEYDKDLEDLVLDEAEKIRKIRCSLKSITENINYDEEEEKLLNNIKKYD